MSTWTRVLITMGLCALVGCADDTAGLDASAGVDAGPAPLEYCQGKYWDLDDEGQITFGDVPCARGSVCGDGLAYQICQVGEDQARPFGSDVRPDVVRWALDELPGYPFCGQSEATALGDRCLYQPGCEDPSGVWCRDLVCGSGDIVAITACQEEPGCQLVYCGCDGQTYEGLPFFPYKHPGPCL